MAGTGFGSTASTRPAGLRHSPTSRHRPHGPGYGAKHITADAEGLTINDTGRGRGYLLASSQGDDTFVVYTRTGTRYLTTFAVGAGKKADGSQESEESDGAAVTSPPVPGHPRGLLVVQDGFNTPDVTGSDGEVRTNTDFKYVDRTGVAALL